MAQDTLDTYFGKQIYKTYNEELNRRKLGQTGANVSSPLVNLSTSIPVYSRSSGGTSYSSPVSTASVSTHYSGTAAGAGGSSSYSQLVNSLSRLVATLTAYVSSLTAGKAK